MQQNIDYTLVSIIKSFLGSPKSEGGGENRSQWEFNCPSPKCKHDVNKYNLNYNSQKKVFKCWKCNYSGYIHKLVKNYGGKNNYSNLIMLLPTERVGYNIFKKPEIDYSLVTCDLPKEYIPINKGYINSSWKQRMAMEYLLEKRKISQSIIDKYGIGYTEEGEFKNRIVIPSKNKEGKYNYFEARDYTGKAKPTYLKPKDVHKDHIIFNEKEINWDLPVYIVEGVFDMFRVPNSIPMLGKSPSDLLISKILKYNPTITLCLDSDAIFDSQKIYKNLSSLGIDVYQIDMTGLSDLSKIYEDYGFDGIYHLIKSRKKINFDDIFEKLL